MRRTGGGIRTVRPASSVTSRKVGEAAEMEDPLCARVATVHDNRAAIAPPRVIRNRLEANCFKNLTGRVVSLHQQTSPTRHPGASSDAPSREERGLLRHGRVAWLTAFQPITVA